MNGARLFLSPGSIEPTDDISGVGDGVSDQASFLSRRAALRADPLNTAFINWPVFEDRYENTLNGNSSSGNRYRYNYALGELRKLDINILVQITGSESKLPITDEDDWAGKWEFWQHYYAQAFYLGREFDVERYQMFNEPNHSNAGGLTIANWLMRLQLASDAIQTALSDVNDRYGKSLTPLIYGPVNSGGDQYNDWGEAGVLNRHTNFLGEEDDNYWVMHRYDYHQYNDTPAQFASDLNRMRSAISADMAPETRFRMSISEFNVHTNGFFDTIPETLDTPEKYARLGAISALLARNFQKELYCFKFGQTLNANSEYLVAKNGMHYQQSSGAPYTTGGATRAAEVWRLFNKALKPGGDQMRFDRDVDGSIDDLEFRATFDPSTNNYYIFSVNESSSAQLTIDVSAWNIPAGTPVLLEEVSEDYYGGVRRWGVVSADGLLLFNSDNPEDIDILQKGNDVWLITIPAGDLQPEETVMAGHDATVTDGVYANTTYVATDSLLARNDPSTRDNRSAGLIQFDLPAIYPPDIQLAALSVEGRTNTADASVQCHLYGLDDDSWSEQESLTWSNAPNLQQGAAAGNLISNRYITDQGDSAFIQGQFVFDRTDYRNRMINVTSFLKQQTDQKVSFLISQDPRWDVGLPDLTTGDTQVDGVEILSVEGSSTEGPQLRIVRRLDTDNDGISDEAEVDVFSTDPNLADADGDNLNDGQELLLYNTDPAKADTDGDGSSDYLEVLAGTDPTDPASNLKLGITVLRADGSVEISWNSTAGLEYTVYRTTDLRPVLESDLVRTVIGLEGTTTYIDHPSSSAKKHFYRIGVKE